MPPVPPIPPSPDRPTPNAALIAILIALGAMLVVFGLYALSKWLSKPTGRGVDPASARSQMLAGHNEKVPGNNFMGRSTIGVNESGDNSVSMDFDAQNAKARHDSIQ